MGSPRGPSSGGHFLPISIQSLRGWVIYSLRSLLLPIALCTLAPRLAGQAPSGGEKSDKPEAARQTWQLDNVLAAYCVQFLVAPKLAAKILPDRFVPARADKVPDLHPVLRAAIAQPTDSFAAWTPSQLCTVQYDAATVGGHRFTNGKGRSQVVAVWSLWGTAAPASEGGAGAGAEGPPILAAVRLSTTDWHLTLFVKQDFIELDDMDAAVSKDPENPGEDLYSMKLGRTTVDWTGHLTGDTLHAGSDLDRSWWAEGSRNIIWTVRSSFQPTGGRLMVGSLRVSGKDNLAKALKESPVRWVGPMYWGGGGRLQFIR
jgi:hypothetical protein